jgi:hypothetical protein
VHDSLLAPLHKHSAQRLAVVQVQVQAWERVWEQGDLWTDVNLGASLMTQLSKKYHPDAQGGSAAQFHQINDAYSVLGDDSKR